MSKASIRVRGITVAGVGRVSVFWRRSGRRWLGAYIIRLGEADEESEGVVGMPGRVIISGCLPMAKCIPTLFVADRCSLPVFDPLHECGSLQRPRGRLSGSAPGARQE